MKMSDISRKPRRSMVSEGHSLYGMKTYVSLFSSAGVGCYGFEQEGYYCIATVELLARRLKIQKYNKKCALNGGYICGDMTEASVQDKVFEQLRLWRENFCVDDLDVLISTPPCQGMSVANHKKKDELKRNSLVVESIKMTMRIKPKFFIFENVRAFLNSVCTDVDGTDKTIREAICSNLQGSYNILFRVVNFKDYGSPSSRTRTLVIGVRKDLRDVTPYDVFPSKQPEKTLRQTIGHLPSLKAMGEISPDDIYHSFRRYSPRMEAWISEIKEGQSAFDNTDASRIPHTIKNGVVVYNARKNGDKYTRQYWDKVAPCVHTRNDILASQNTVHPQDNRVFSIRELMLMMSVPKSFQWSENTLEELNSLPLREKEAFLKKEAINIRQNLGEAVPTIIFRQIAKKIKNVLERQSLSEQQAKRVIEERNLADQDPLISYIRKSPLGFAELTKIAELANAQRTNNAAYYTRQDVCFSVVNSLPEAKGYSSIDILEPSVGVGNFIPMLIEKYSEVPVVNIDVIDVNPNSIEVLKELVKKMKVPSNVSIRYIVGDFLLQQVDRAYDIVIGNPPFGNVIKDKKLIARYKQDAVNKETNNLFSFFLEKAMRIGKVVSMIVPKSLISSPEYNETRSLLQGKRIGRIIDFGEKAFKGVKIETIAITVYNTLRPQKTTVESYITGGVSIHDQAYITDKRLPYWVIYRDSSFDETASSMRFNVFKVYRDRVITKSKTKGNGRIRVLKSRNIGDNRIVDIPGYDSYIDNVSGLDVARYMNHTDCVLVPNLTYHPRACFMPKDCVADGSVAILTPINPAEKIEREDLAFFSTEKFANFYAIARNRGTRSLNIDNNSVFFFGKNKG